MRAREISDKIRPSLGAVLEEIRGLGDEEEQKRALQELCVAMLLLSSETIVAVTQGATDIDTVAEESAKVVRESIYQFATFRAADAEQ